jgi:hypothetical protein
MKAFSFIALIVAAVSLDSVVAGKVGVQVSHNNHGHKNAGQVGRLTNKARLNERQGSRKCRPRQSKITSSTAAATSTQASSTSTSSTKSSSSSSSKTSSTPAKTSSSAKHIETTNFNNEDKNKGQTNNAVASKTGLIAVVSDQCGSANACHDISNNCGPNGNIEWLTCGVRGGGWNPPNVQVSDLKVVDLNDALKSGDSPFHACRGDLIGKFYQYAGEVGVPPILLASIAMQESSCNPATVGGAGEQGLMQLTKDKCGGAPGGDCKDPDFNIRTGAHFLKGLIDGNGGNVLKSVAQYNGWFPGMTVAKATAIAGSCCRCQQNLDYLQQFFNGWIQNVNAYARNMGVFRNLDRCPIG